ncbi:MAG: phenylalanine--tRNA ligase subunit beta [Smithellaceae bacterium]
MLVSLKWLKDYVDIEHTPSELADRLTMAGLEVDEIKTITPQFTSVVVAKILSVAPHPSADRLSVCEVTDGERVYPVVCGAKNIKAGDVVPMAKVGAVLPGGYTIKSAALRGQTSEGMLCSEAELAIGEDTSGILQLPSDFTLGQTLQAALDLEDTVFDISITPNRSDCLSVMGIAREVAAMTGKKIRPPRVRMKESGEDIRSLTSVKIIDADLCPRYTARMIQNVKIGPSPVWIKSRLEAAGLRPINNVVDVTNFVMLEMGQPLHAFDFRFLEEGRIVVRRSLAGEEFTSLDGKDRVLPEDTLLICDGKKPVAIGGIMGGLNSEVKDDTQVVFLESAYFLPSSIRRCARKLAMPTDAAYRFERGIDPEGVVQALDRAAQLIAETSGGTICRDYIDEYPQKVSVATDIPLRMNRIHEIIGAEISAAEVVRILRLLGMTVRPAGKGRYSVTPPTARVDIAREIDLIEEVVRLYGYDLIPVTVPRAAAPNLIEIPRLGLEEKIRGLMTGAGYSEIINYSFTTPLSVNHLLLPEGDERRKVVLIKNPLSEDLSVMRTTLVYGLLETMKRNANNGSFNLKLFETGRTFIASPSGELPQEMNYVAALLTGVQSDNLWGAKVPVDFYDLKGCLDNLFYDLKLSGARYGAEVSEPFLHPGQSCGVYLKDVLVGRMGAVHPEVLNKMDIRNKAYVFEINLDVLSGSLTERTVYAEISKYPAVTRDVAFVVPVALEADKILDIVLQQREDLLENTAIFDIYAGKGLEEGTKSLGLRFSYRSYEKTLTDAEVNSAHEKIVHSIIQLTGAKIRS